MAVQPDEARPLAELNDFRRDLLKVVEESNGAHGLALKETIEDAYDEREVNHSRLYNSLSDLVELGFVEKSEVDGRTNEYAITPQGEQALAAHREWFSNDH